jgi:two-component system chemotaxis response regulator CheY
MPLDILIVDDSAAIRKILQRVLRQADVDVGQVYEAGDGLEALETLKNHKVHLVLADVNMPNMNGMQLLAEIKSRAEFASLPVIMITTEGSQSKVMEAAQLGAAGYIRKPFSADQIKDKISSLF